MKYLAILLIVLSALVGNAALDRVEHANPFRAVADSLDSQCAEDMSCWDCSTMGNHVCGKVVMP